MSDEPVLRKLQKTDGSISEILERARYAVLYTYVNDSPSSNTEKCWKKEDVEGSLYVTRRKKEPFFAVCILNRVGLNDMIEPLDFGSFEYEYEFNDRFLIFRIRQSIKAIWISAGVNGGVDALDAIKCCFKNAKIQTENAPPIPTYVSPEAKEERVLSKEEVRDGLLRLILNDSFIDKFYSRYVQSFEQRRQPHQPFPQQLPFQQLPGMIHSVAPSFQQYPPRGSYSFPFPPVSVAPGPPSPPFIPTPPHRSSYNYPRG